MGARKKKQEPELLGRAKLLADIHMLHDYMREEILESGVQEAQYNFPLRNEENMTNEQLEEFQAFLQSFRIGPFAGLLTVRSYRPKEFWNNLSMLFGQRKLREQKLLRIEQKKVRNAWHKRYAPPIDEEKLA